MCLYIYIYIYIYMKVGFSYYRRKCSWRGCRTRYCTEGPGSVVGIATGYRLDGQGIESRWRVRFSAPVQTGPGAHPASCNMGSGFFPAVKSGRGVKLTSHPLLFPWSWKGRAIPLLPLWAVRPVQSLSACTRVHFTFLTLLRWGRYLDQSRYI